AVARLPRPALPRAAPAGCGSAPRATRTLRPALPERLRRALRQPLRRRLRPAAPTGRRPDRLLRTGSVLLAAHARRRSRVGRRLLPADPAHARRPAGRPRPAAADAPL
ncbi:MAG: hypothetical protein AVDCRST_MAG38-2301, partial [uncultured Solirubrobacteraceae bacterium]